MDVFDDDDNFAALRVLALQILICSLGIKKYTKVLALRINAL
jgi:hypothetical protein